MNPECVEDEEIVLFCCGQFDASKSYKLGTQLGGVRVGVITNYHSVFIFLDSPAKRRFMNVQHYFHGLNIQFLTTSITGLELLFEIGLEMRSALRFDYRTSFCEDPTLRSWSGRAVLNYRT